jgi:hypothetical protein
MTTQMKALFDRPDGPGAIEEGTGNDQIVVNPT